MDVIAQWSELVSPSFTGRPFIEGFKNPDRYIQQQVSPSFTGRPFIEGFRSITRKLRGSTRRRPLGLSDKMCAFLGVST